MRGELKHCPQNQTNHLNVCSGSMDNSDLGGSITNLPLLLHGVVTQTRRARETRLTITSVVSHK